MFQLLRYLDDLNNLFLNNVYAITTTLQYRELTPNKTRRAQCANWLIFYREELFGYTVEELRERRRLKKEAEAEAEAKRIAEEGEDADDWKPPVKEVF